MDRGTRAKWTSLDINKESTHEDKWTDRHYWRKAVRDYKGQWIVKGGGVPEKQGDAGGGWMIRPPAE